MRIRELAIGVQVLSVGHANMKNLNAVALGSLGGKKAAMLMTKEQLIARAKKAVAARIAKRKK